MESGCSVACLSRVQQHTGSRVLPLPVLERVCEEEGRRHTSPMETIATLIPDPLFKQVQSIVQEHDHKVTKELLLLARHMGLAEGDGNFANLTRRITTRLFELPCFNPSGRPPGDNLHQTDPSIRINGFFRNPLNAAGIIMSCFLAPHTLEEEKEKKLESYMKEIRVMDSDPYSPDIDFTPFFGNYSAQMHPDIPKNPKMASTVHKAIDTWRQWASQYTQYPKMSKKLLPTHTREEMRKYVDRLIQDPAEATPASLEWLYVRYGDIVEGPCELSQRWYTNGVSPRSYFVAGPTAYDKTKNTKDLWNKLVDSLSVTHRKNRVNPGRVHVSGIKQALFYDLTSFTSNMALQRPFLSNLSIYCRGQKITVMDGLLGPIEKDLGDIIAEYNEMNFRPEYIWRESPDWLPDTHGVAGFLGVFGNIATCTFLHGAIILQLCEHSYECGCAGDDAVVVVEDEGTVWCCVALLGILAVEKTYSISDQDVVYLKRRTWIDQRAFCLRSAVFFQLPSFLHFFKRTDLHRFREGHMTRRELKDLAAQSLGASFRSAAILLRGGDKWCLKEFMTSYYSLCGFPHTGNIPQLHRQKNARTKRFVPSLESFGQRDYVQVTIQSLYQGTVYLPLREDTFESVLRLRKDTVFRSRGGPFLQYLQKLGVIEAKRKVTQEFIGEVGYEKLLAEWDHPEPCWYTYTSKMDVPDWLWGGQGRVTGTYEYDYLGTGSVSDGSDDGLVDSVIVNAAPSGPRES